MAALNEIDEILRNNGLDNMLDQMLVEPVTAEPVVVIPVVPVAPVMPDNNLDNGIGQGMPPEMLAVDIGKVYLSLFNDYIQHRYGIHWPMTIYFKNMAKNPWDLTLVVPNPSDFRHLQSMDDSRHPGRYQDIKDTLIALTDEWSINIKFL